MSEPHEFEVVEGRTVCVTEGVPIGECNDLDRCANGCICTPLDKVDAGHEPEPDD